MVGSEREGERANKKRNRMGRSFEIGGGDDPRGRREGETEEKTA